MIASVYSWFGKSIPAALALVAFPFTSAQGAGTLADPRWQIHGFASQTLISTTDNNFFGSTDDSVSPDFRELGLNASYRPDPNWLIAAQVVSRRAGEVDDGKPRLDFAFVDYGVVSGPGGRTSVMLGKVKNPLGLYNTTRDVAFTRPSILLPQSIYFDRARNVGLSSTGIHVLAEMVGENSVLETQFGVAIPDLADNSTEYAFLGRDRPGEFSGDLSVIGRVLYDIDGGRWRMALTGAQLQGGYEPAPGDPLASGAIRFQPWILSLQYNAEKWTLTTEYARRHSHVSGFGVFPNQQVTGESYYVQAGYRFNPKWEGVIRYDVLYQDINDRKGTTLAAQTGRPAYSAFAKDLTLGLRYDMTQNFMLRGEIHFVDGTGWLPLQDNPSASATQRRWNMFLLQAAYRF